MIEGSTSKGKNRGVGVGLTAAVGVVGLLRRPLAVTADIGEVPDEFAGVNLRHLVRGVSLAQGGGDCEADPGVLGVADLDHVADDFVFEVRCDDGEGPWGVRLGSAYVVRIVPRLLAFSHLQAELCRHGSRPYVHNAGQAFESFVAIVCGLACNERGSCAGRAECTSGGCDNSIFISVYGWQQMILLC